MKNSLTYYYRNVKLTWILAIVIGVLMVTATSCSDSGGITGPDDSGEIEEGNGINVDDLEAYKGDLGLIINSRDLVKKGYNPVKVKITTTASQGNYDQELDVDAFTNIAQLKLPVEDLSEDAKPNSEMVSDWK